MTNSTLDDMLLDRIEFSFQGLPVVRAVWACVHASIHPVCLSLCVCVYISKRRGAFSLDDQKAKPQESFSFPVKSFDSIGVSLVLLRHRCELLSTPVRSCQMSLRLFRRYSTFLRTRCYKNEVCC